MLSKPERKGYVLTGWGEDMYSEWQDIGGCSCHLGGAPCHSCVHEGNPISLEENDEAWELCLPKENTFWRQSFKLPKHDDWVKPLSEEDFKKLVIGEWKTEVEIMSRSEIVNKSTTKDSPTFESAGRVIKRVKIPEGYSVNPKSLVGYEGSASDYYSECIYLGWTPPLLVDNGHLLKSAEPKLDKQEEKVDTIKVSGFCSGSPLKDVYDKWAEAQTTRATIVKGRTDSVNEPSGRYVYDTQLNNLFNQQEEISMSNAITTRKIVNVTLIDNDPALDVQHSVVAQFDNLVTEDTNDVLIQEILMNPDFDVAGKIQEHNDVRANEVDLAVLKSTGNQVSLQPVKLKQLTWLVK